MSCAQDRRDRAASHHLRPALRVEVYPSAPASRLYLHPRRVRGEQVEVDEAVVGTVAEPLGLALHTGPVEPVRLRDVLRGGVPGRGLENEATQAEPALRRRPEGMS